MKVAPRTRTIDANLGGPHRCTIRRAVAIATQMTTNEWLVPIARIALLVGAHAVFACGAPERDGGGLGASSGGESAGSGNVTATATAGEAGGPETDGGTGGAPPDSDTGSASMSGSSGSSGDDTRLDVGAGGSGAGEGRGYGCTKVDFLFVIDHSGSMADEQQNLIASFPGFIQSISSTLMSDDYQILVADTGAFMPPNYFCSRGKPEAPCEAFCYECFAGGCDCTCGGAVCPPLPACDGELGTGRRAGGRRADCGVVGDQRYIVGGQPDLEGTFSCLASVGTTGSGLEQPMGAVVGAVSDAMTGPGGCNEGFIRDDAILVVTYITDEEDIQSMGDPAAWRQALVDAKNGDERAVVVLALVGDTGLPDAVCEPFANTTGAQDAPQLRSLAESFPFGQWASVCAPDYSPFFAEAVSVIDTACDEFDPVG